MSTRLVFLLILAAGCGPRPPAERPCSMAAPRGGAGRLKFDIGLENKYRDYLACRSADTEVRVTLTYKGNLEAIEALGFRTEWRQEVGHAGGVIAFSRLEHVAEHPGVIQIMWGREPQAH